MIYEPDFDEACFKCGATPTVIIPGHVVPDTKLCGVHFFNDRRMVDWEEWNTKPEDTE